MTLTFATTLLLALAPPPAAGQDTLVLTGVVQHCARREFILEADNRRTEVHIRRWQRPPNTGDLVVVTGPKPVSWRLRNNLNATSLSVVGKGPISPVRMRRLAELDPVNDNLFTVETEAQVADVMPDEIDSRYDILLLRDGSCQVPLFIPASPTSAAWLGARIRVRARYTGIIVGTRRFSGPYLLARRPDIRVLEPAGTPESAPPIDLNELITPEDVMTMGRRSFVGKVLATWGGNNVMLASNGTVNARLATGMTLPPVGSVIRIAGYPQTDIYKLNLVQASWRLLAEPGPEEAPPAKLTPITNVIQRTDEKQTFAYHHHGKLVRFVGTVRILPPADSRDPRVLIDVGSHRVAIDVSSCPEVLKGLSPDCTVDVTGRCLMEVDAWRPYDLFQHITGFAVILRRAADLKVIRSPPWWTPGRLFALVIALTALLVGVSIWNRLLQRQAERRGRQLYRAEIGRAGEALRVEERTRLAVELHDSLSQNLTGVALQLKAGRHDMAAQALKSCREELRNCLWDLRSNAIDCDSMDEALRQTLAPHVEGARLSVRFNVKRSAVSDTTAYAIMRIIRELVTNAIRHGHAADIRVAGRLEPTRILFSVRDDGCGFDPAARPGIAEGHFGLQGVEERAEALGGEMTIASTVGKGTRVTVEIPVTHGSDNTKTT